MGLLLLMGDSGQRPLLDSYTAAVGYSLRRLRTAYTGSAVRVRRSSDNAEQDIGFVSGRLDTASLLSFCGAGNGFVTTWYDQVGTNNAGQGTAADQPQIVSSGSLIVTERNVAAIQFIDVSGATISPFLSFDPWHTAAQAYVGTFAVYSLTANGSIPYLAGSNPNDTGLASLHNGVTRQVRTGTGRTVGTFANGSALNIDQTYVRHDTADRSRIKTFLDVTESTTIDAADTNANFTLPTKYLIGNTQAISTQQSIKINEFIGFTTDQTANQLLIRTNQKTFWNP